MVGDPLYGHFSSSNRSRRRLPQAIRYVLAHMSGPTIILEAA